MENMFNYIVDNWTTLSPIVIGAAWFIVRLTPTEKDNDFLKWLLELIPNFKKGGGKHK